MDLGAGYEEKKRTNSNGNIEVIPTVVYSTLPAGYEERKRTNSNGNIEVIPVLVKDGSTGGSFTYDDFSLTEKILSLTLNGETKTVDLSALTDELYTLVDGIITGGYLKNVTLNENILTFTKNDDTTLEITLPSGGVSNTVTFKKYTDLVTIFGTAPTKYGDFDDYMTANDYDEIIFYIIDNDDVIALPNSRVGTKVTVIKKMDTTIMLEVRNDGDLYIKFGTASASFSGTGLYSVTAKVQTATNQIVRTAVINIPIPISTNTELFTVVCSDGQQGIMQVIGNVQFTTPNETVTFELLLDNGNTGVFESIGSLTVDTRTVTRTYVSNPIIINGLTGQSTLKLQATGTTSVSGNFTFYNISQRTSIFENIVN